MAPVVRYRYVDFGTVFTGDPRTRGADANAESPATLFANELATDVGGTCWGANEPLVVIDHRASATQFPSASAAVLHKANRIRERFTQSGFDLIWLVTHEEPDFDAFCSMYLARWIVESPDAAVDWQSYGLNPDGWLDLADKPKIDWFNLDLNRVPKEHRWPMLLAGYASYLDGRRPISCPRQRALHSILWAALKRGRDYMKQTSGATEFFDEVRSCLLADELNPIFDSVLEGSTRFAPELAMLDREAAAYERDLQRARKAIVFLPEAEAPSPQFFKTPKEVLLQEIQGKPQEVNAEDLLLADTFRIPTDGVYLRDPECLLFQEWARLDLENSALGAGLEFTAIATSNRCPDGTASKTDYVFSIAPDRAKGRHLYTVWSRLQTKEVEALRQQNQSQATPAYVEQPLEQRPASTLLADPWFGGQSSFGTLVRTPSRGTSIGPPGERNDLRDDPVVEEVRTELENAIYSPQSSAGGPQVTVTDFPATQEVENQDARQFDLNTPLQIPPAQNCYFRFASIVLRADVPILPSGNFRYGLANQIGETLWQVLYPEQPGALPADFAERHLHLAADSVEVWGDRGLAVAEKPSAAPDAARVQNSIALHDDFARLISVVRDIDRLRTGVLDGIATALAPADNDHSVEAIAAQAQELRVRAVEVEHMLTLPGHDLLRRFAEVIDVDGCLVTLHDLSLAVEDLRRRQLAEEARRVEERSRIQSRLRWLRVFVLGLIALVTVDVLTRWIELSSTMQRFLTLVGGPLVIALSAWFLAPWRRTLTPTKSKTNISAAMLAAAIAMFVIGWLAELLRIWSK